MKNKKVLTIILIVVLVGIALVAFIGIRVFNNLTAAYGPSSLNNEKEVLAFLAKEDPENEYEVVGHVSYEFGAGSLNCTSGFYLARRWKVKNVNTGELHQVYEDIDIQLNKTIQITIDENGDEHITEQSIGQYADHNGQCFRIPRFV